MSLTDIATQLLQPAINFGLLEKDFWEMTIAEIQRYVDGAIWRMKQQAQFDYTLSNLIGASVARLFAKNSPFPPIEEVYTGLYEKELKEKHEEEDKTANSINNFMAFAMAHNSNRKKELSEKNE